MLEIALPKILQGSLEFWIPFSWNLDFGFPVSGTGIPDSARYQGSGLLEQPRSGFQNLGGTFHERKFPRLPQMGR